MRLDRVTITGADDSVSPLKLRELSAEFPFVEWGILVSESQTGSPRFPSHEWIKDLQAIARPMQLSLHVCGKWIRNLLIGNNTIPKFLFEGFGRIQLNFHAEGTPCFGAAFHRELVALGQKQFIFQIDGAKGNAHLQMIYEENGLDRGDVDAVALFDLSGGAGIVPAQWPSPQYMTNDVDYAYHGYAGGLGPHNLVEELGRISEAAATARIWIDMETHVRSENDSEFDLTKARRALEICAPDVALCTM